MHMDVALKVAECVAKTYREDMNSAEVLEGMWLAMQMVGGPKNAAAVERNDAQKKRSAI